jgi:hypothetical protein
MEIPRVRGQSLAPSRCPFQNSTFLVHCRHRRRSPSVVVAFAFETPPPLSAPNRQPRRDDDHTPPAVPVPLFLRTATSRLPARLSRKGSYVRTRVSWRRFRGGRASPCRRRRRRPTVRQKAPLTARRVAIAR